ncbi:MAG: hypothetical protein COB46_03570 [Rhodospirillaceae bacterium]|nr:MAG: hypothetical protein COB46_03570 [Rhodospirillaceae bacterium]
MKLNLERYPMNDILRYFHENGMGHEDAVLEALAEGALIGSIKFPSYDPRWKDIPVDYWESIDASDLISLSQKYPGRKQIDEICVEGEVLYDSELERLNTLAESAANHDAKLIDKHLRPLVFEKLGVKNINEISNWLELIHVFEELSFEFHKECKQAFDVFVLAENWSRFISDQGPAELSKNIGGKPNDKYWPDLLWVLVKQIVDTQNKNIQQIAGFKHRSELARYMHDTVAKEKQLKKGRLVDTNRISQVLGDKLPKK